MYTYDIRGALMTNFSQISASVLSLSVGRRSAALLLSSSVGKIGISRGTSSGWPSSRILLGSEGLYNVEIITYNNNNNIIYL